MSMSFSNWSDTVASNNIPCVIVVDIICMHMAYANQSTLCATLSHHSKIHLGWYCSRCCCCCCCGTSSCMPPQKIQYKQAIFVSILWIYIFIIFMIICVLGIQFLWWKLKSIRAVDFGTRSVANVIISIIWWLCVRCACVCLLIHRIEHRKKSNINTDNTFVECNFYYISDSIQKSFEK